MQIAVIIPMLDEAARAGGLLDDLRGRDLAEIIVVDGGSADDTRAVVGAFAEVSLLQAGAGRARQMNAGAAAATSEVLLFLHADVRLPEDAAGQIRAALSDERFVGGAFKTRTVHDGAGRRWIRPLLRLADLRSRYSRLPYGDQGIFVRASVFRALGGFPEIPLLEDLAFSERLRDAGRVARAPGRVRVSGRRFVERPFYYAALMNVFPALYRLGVSPERLARLYRRVR